MKAKPTHQKDTNSEAWRKANIAAGDIIDTFHGLKIDAPNQKIMTEQLFFRLRRELFAFWMEDWMNSDAEFNTKKKKQKCTCKPMMIKGCKVHLPSCKAW